MCIRIEPPLELVSKNFKNLVIDEASIFYAPMKIEIAKSAMALAKIY